jgi:hypothetical protein
MDRGESRVARGSGAMTYEKKTAFSYRARAEELRTLAELDRLEETRRMLLDVARSYDAMAENMEAILQAHWTMRKHG